MNHNKLVLLAAQVNFSIFDHRFLFQFFVFLSQTYQIYSTWVQLSIKYNKRIISCLEKMPIYKSWLLTADFSTLTSTDQVQSTVQINTWNSEEWIWDNRVVTLLWWNSRILLYFIKRFILVFFLLVFHTQLWNCLFYLILSYLIGYWI